MDYPSDLRETAGEGANSKAMANRLVSQSHLRDLEEAEEGPEFTSDNGQVNECGNLVHEYSEDSEDSEEPYEGISEQAREEMTKLESIFHAKGLRFRMIDRIGEGMYVQLVVCFASLKLSLIVLNQEPFLLSIRPRTNITTSIRTTGISKLQMEPHGLLHRSIRDGTKTLKINKIDGD